MKSRAPRKMFELYINVAPIYLTDLSIFLQDALVAMFTSGSRNQLYPHTRKRIYSDNISIRFQGIHTHTLHTLWAGN